VINVTRFQTIQFTTQSVSKSTITSYTTGSFSIGRHDARYQTDNIKSINLLVCCIILTVG